MGLPENWHGVLNAGPSDARRIALDMPVFEEGQSLDSIPLITEYVRDYIDTQLTGPVVLAGNSLGGHVSLHLALQRPQRVVGLVLSGSSGLFEREFGSHRGANPSREWYRNKMQDVFFDPAHVTEEMLDRVMDTLGSRRCRRILVHIAKSAKRDNLATRLGEVTCPTLLLWGKQDIITPPEVAHEFHEKIPNAELDWLDDCCHAAMIERPETFADAVCRWWSKTFSTGLPDVQGAPDIPAPLEIA